MNTDQGGQRYALPEDEANKSVSTANMKMDKSTHKLETRRETSV